MKKLFRDTENVLAIIIAGVMAIIFGINSPLHPWIGAESGIDSSVFKTVTLMMEHGYMPYRDSFDHKGPILYLLNWLGNRLSQYRGIWVIETVVIGITFYSMYKIARLSTGVVASSITVLVASSTLFEYFEGGNFTEEYAMPCIAIAIFIFLDYLINARISRWRLISLGVCCGIVLMLRPNMIAVWFVYCIVIVVNFVLKKNIRELLYSTRWFCLGLMLIFLPILIWLGINDDIYYFIHDYVLFNFQYASSAGGRAVFPAKWQSFFVFFNMPINVIAFLCLLFHIKDSKLISISYCGYMVLTILWVVLSGKAYGHYGMILIPAVVYPISLIFADIERVKEPLIVNAMMMIVSLYFFSAFIWPNWMGTISEMATYYDSKDEENRCEETINVANMIDSYTDDTDKISVYGNWDVIYVMSNRMHATRYSYQFPIGEVAPKIMDEYMDSLQKELPKVIVTQTRYFDENIKEFLNRNGYSLQYSSDPEMTANRTLLYFKDSK